jgi:copper oxidase (laccase) domain-containing protein
MAQTGVRAMAERFGCDPANLRAAIGPCIGGCCYETGPEVPEAMLRLPADVSDCLTRRQGRRVVII